MLTSSNWRRGEVVFGMTLWIGPGMPRKMLVRRCTSQRGRREDACTTICVARARSAAQRVCDISGNHRFSRANLFYLGLHTLVARIQDPSALSASALSGLVAAGGTFPRGALDAATDVRRPVATPSHTITRPPPGTSTHTRAATHTPRAVVSSCSLLCMHATSPAPLQLGSPGAPLTLSTCPARTPRAASITRAGARARLSLTWKVNSRKAHGLCPRVL